MFFSGAKGFHVGLPLTLAGSPEPSDGFHQVAKRFAVGIAERQGVTIDTGVYDRVRIFRRRILATRKPGYTSGG